MSVPKYDVFLSFRGEDTRKNFTSHLHKELCGQNIETFIDYELERGDEINSSLVEAIKESLIYVVILSKHYASSSWCLDELIEILKCKEDYGREVIPVFYEVDPSDVRHQRHSYAEDLVKHHQRFGDKVDEWKAALSKVSGLSGWDSQATRSESTFVTEIVKDIVNKLNRCVSSDYEGMTGIDMHIEQIQSLLHLELPTVRIIGIWGMGGIGKTTIASAVFEKLAPQFKSKSIIRNVQQEIERVGLFRVKKEYLSQLLSEKITSSESNAYDQRLKRTKGLIVFDDVKDADQLKDLIGTHHKFGQGSRLIVTSRNRQVLENANAHEIYQVSGMDCQDSLKLFCSFAFKQNHPKESFVSLTEKVLDYAKGLPLALKVLGSLLYRKSEKVWESELQKLKNLPDHDIFKLLKLSYDGLDEEQKNIFLDIACFFRGEWEKVVALILDSCGFSACKGMDDLKDRGLISISKGRVWMHDLIQEMGHEIVKLQCDDDPGKRSRLWKPSDIYDVLSNNKGKGTNKIQCIFVNMWEMSAMTEIKVQLDAETFEEMHNLRMIKFYNQYWEPVTFYAFLKSFPKHLKFLCWDGFPQRSLPQDFCPKNLVILHMPHSNLEQLWEGDQSGDDDLAETGTKYVLQVHLSSHEMALRNIYAQNQQETIKKFSSVKFCYCPIAMSDLKYDVFLSFRGEDTRDNFTSHLYAELCRKNIETFIDYRLDRGEEISPALYKAIEESKIYVIILSEHYASSSWCLDELTEILNCKESYGREVIPVFYKVDPSNVRHQRQSYADDLVKHHQRFGDKMDVWKAALTQVAGLSGWNSQVTSPESILVEKIAEDIFKKLNRHVSSGYYEGLTGMDKHIEEIQSLLQLELPTVRMIGIWGMGGIGKSTIANAIFEKFETQFNSRCCIVPDVQQEIEKTDVEHVKNKYLSKLLNEDIKSSESNSSIVGKLKRAKVLIVFDDVKDFDQLQNLNGTHDNFIEGSRIIVTSRDKQVLKNANADEIYKVSEMDYQDSLQLFHSFAFKHNRPIEETYVSLSKEVLDYANGLPLALQVLGSMLYGKPKEVWESQLQKLKKLPDRKIFRLLKLSYDGLDDEQKNIFLDIACFFRGEWEKVVALILDSCGFSACKGMDDLKDRGLISISKGRVWMHDLIQEMGHEIVRLQCDDDPGKRSRLWKASDIYDVLRKGNQ
ncbi:hypothetical protein TSUD_79130 [Trifolium subterraneum]|uniref:ADP-ribosyl cyclase/cyclic ADP-ribose hydrolase n=1 Tax=Trifolium subterraneum TaxID=3900 RepID=A0A2Z6LRM1_TRISU|nr:hypothetical protein TSUD_79130 [Trifolium subterraneum]